MDGRAKLVYTSDQNSTDFLNNKVVPIVNKSEVVSSIHEDLSNMNKTKRRTIMEKGKQGIGHGFLISEIEIKSLWKLILQILRSEPTTATKLFTEALKWRYIHKVPLEKRKKFFENTMQTMKYGSHFIVFSKNMLWQLQTTTSTDDEIVDFIWSHRNDRFNKKIRNELIEKHGSHLTKRKKTETKTEPIKSKIDVLHKHISVDGKTVIQKFTSSNMTAELKIEPLVNAMVKTHVSSNSLIIDVSW